MDSTANMCFQEFIEGGYICVPVPEKKKKKKKKKTRVFPVDEYKFNVKPADRSRTKKKKKKNAGRQAHSPAAAAPAAVAPAAVAPAAAATAEENLQPVAQIIMPHPNTDNSNDNEPGRSMPMFPTTDPEDGLLFEEGKIFDNIHPLHIFSI